MSPEMHSAMTALRSLAARWGFTEDAVLRSLHLEIFAVLTSGQPARELWIQYRDASEAQIDWPQEGQWTFRLRAAREIACGLIYLEAGDYVPGLNYLLLAKAAAHSSGWTEDENLLKESIAKLGTAAEQRQAEAYFHEDASDILEAVDKYEEALDIYLETDNDSTISDVHRGYINYRSAECYLGLLRLGAGNDDWLQEQIVASLESAGNYLEGTEWFLRWQALLDQTSREDWWDAAVERQQS